MTNPNVAAATDALRQESAIWADQSATLKTLTATVESLRLPTLEFGIFIILKDAYTRMVDTVQARCAEGVGQTNDIATALQQIATVYDDEEQRNIHRMTGLY